MQVLPESSQDKGIRHVSVRPFSTPTVPKRSVFFCPKVISSGWKLTRQRNTPRFGTVLLKWKRALHSSEGRRSKTKVSMAILVSFRSLNILILPLCLSIGPWQSQKVHKPINIANFAVINFVTSLQKYALGNQKKLRRKTLSFLGSFVTGVKDEIYSM